MSLVHHTKRLGKRFVGFMPVDTVRRMLPDTFIKYAIMAVLVVGIEIGSFWVMESPLGINYLVATVVSQLIGILLNWVGSRYFVFGPSRHSIKREFTLVAVTSLAGVGLQTAIVYLVVSVLNGDPLAGKLVAIVLTFVWNYFVRKKFIFNDLATSPTLDEGL